MAKSGNPARCNICGLVCGRGGALKKHVEGAHKVPYDKYSLCFARGSTTSVDVWEKSTLPNHASSVTHVWVRRFDGIE